MKEKEKPEKWISFQEAKMYVELDRQRHNEWVVNNFDPFVHQFLLKPLKENKTT